MFNLLLRPVDSKHNMTAKELAAERALQHEDRAVTHPAQSAHAARGNFGLAGVLAWAAIGIPFAIGVYIAIQKAAVLF